MANGSVMNNNLKSIMIYRSYTNNTNLSSTEWLPPSQFKVGIDNTSPSVSDIDLSMPIPISNGIINDTGENTMTGSNGGNNTTDNTSVYKIGASLMDNTGQNLNVNNTNANKTWLISNLATNGVVIDKTKYVGFWLYIKDQTTLDYFLNSGTCLEARFEVDSSNYFKLTYEKTNLSIGWNWINSNKILVENLTETGTIGTSTISGFRIIIITNNATDEWNEGDVVFDLLRQWSDSDLLKNFENGYPSINTLTFEATTRGYLSSVEANGFNLNAIGSFNKDSSIKMTSTSVFIQESKSDTDEFAFIEVDRLI